jgi:hypothetical protein
MAGREVLLNVRKEKRNLLWNPDRKHGKQITKKKTALLVGGATRRFQQDAIALLRGSHVPRLPYTPELWLLQIRPHDNRRACITQ